MKSVKYSNAEVGAMLTLAMIIVWAWMYYGHRHSMSGRYGHPVYAILGLSGIIMLTLMIKRSSAIAIPGKGMSALHSFRWTYIASIGLTSLALATMTFCPHCADVKWPDYPPTYICDWTELPPPQGMGYEGPIPPPYGECYNPTLQTPSQPHIPYCYALDPDEDGHLYTGDLSGKAALARDKYEQEGIVDFCQFHLNFDDHEWPPASHRCDDIHTDVGTWLFCDAITGLRILMPLAVMVGFLIPLVGMSNNELSEKIKKYSGYGGFFVVLIILFIYAHLSHAFYRGTPWYMLKYSMDWTVFFFYGISAVHIIYCYKAYKKFQT